MANDFSGISVDLALSFLAIVISAAAIVVSLVTFRIGQKSLKVSEQVIISKEIWDAASPLNNKLHEYISGTPDFKELRLTMTSLRDELEYFLFLADKKVIKEPNILYHYYKSFSEFKENVNKINETKADVKGWDVSKDIVVKIQEMEKRRDSVGGSVGKSVPEEKIY